MKILLDLFPILVFFAGYKLYDIYTGTAALMVATVVQMAVIYAMERKLQFMQKATLVLILGFGSLTLALHDERFIKWKPTVLYAAIALGLALALWGYRKNFLKLLLGGQLDLPDAVWHRLNIAWVVYAVFMALANAFVVVYFSTEAWVNFKLWGYAFPLGFLIAQGLYIAPYLKDDLKKDPPP
jgi:intracellular septation protein